MYCVHTHQRKDDCSLDFTDGIVKFTYHGNPDETASFHTDPEDLFLKLSEHFDKGKYQELFSVLSFPAKDALWGTLYYLDQPKNHELICKLYPQW